MLRTPAAMLANAAQPVRLKLAGLGLGVGVALFAAVAGQVHAQARRTPVKSAIELVPASQAVLGALEVEAARADSASASRQAVTDARLFVSKTGGDIDAALAAAEIGDDHRPAAQHGALLFSVRLLIVADGRLYTGARGQCGGWQHDVARCTAACDGGTFAIRRHGAATLEVLIGAVPGAEDVGGAGILLSGCGFETEAGEANLVPKSGRGLAVVGFSRD